MAKRTNGEGTWGKKTIRGIEYVRYRKKYEGIGFKDFYGKRKKDVQEKIKEYEKEYKNLKPILTQPITFGDFMETWINEEKTKSLSNPLSRRTIDELYDVFNNRIRNTCFDRIQLGQISQDVCKKYIDELINRKYAKASIDKALVYLRQCLKYAYETNQLNTDISQFLLSPSEKSVKKKKKEISVLSEDDIEKLYVEAKRMGGTGISGTPIGEFVYGNNGYAIIFIMYTGIRVGEFLELRWKDFNLAENYVSISRSFTRVSKIDNRKEREDMIKEPKTSSGKRTIPLCDRALECVNYFKSLNPDYELDDLFAVTRNNTRMGKDNLRRSLNAMLKRANCSVSECGLHVLRHSFGSYLLTEEGVDIAIISSLLGHSKVSTTYDIYIHIIEKQKIKVIQLFNKKSTI